MKTTALIGNPSESTSEPDSKRISVSAEINKNRVSSNDNDEAFLTNESNSSTQQKLQSKNKSLTAQEKNESKLKTENSSQKGTAVVAR